MNNRNASIVIKGQPRLDCGQRVVTTLSHNPRTETIAFITAYKQDYLERSLIGRLLFGFLEACANRPNSDVVFVLTPVINLVAKCAKRHSNTRFASVKSFQFHAELKRNELRIYNKGRRVDVDGEWHNLFVLFVGPEFWEFWLTQEDADRLMPIVFN